MLICARKQFASNFFSLILGLFFLTTTCTKNNTSDQSASAEELDKASQPSGCSVLQTDLGALITCVNNGILSHATLKHGKDGKDGINGEKGEAGKRGSSGPRGIAGRDGEGIPDITIAWCHHTADHKDVQLYIPLKEFLLGKHFGYGHEFDFAGECEEFCSCNECEN